MLKFTLREKLTGDRGTKPVGATCEEYTGRLYRKPCSCGRGFVEYDYDRWGRRFSLHRVCIWGRDLSGELEFADCCKQCADEQAAELDAELADED